MKPGDIVIVNNYGRMTIHEVHKNCYHYNNGCITTKEVPGYHFNLKSAFISVSSPTLKKPDNVPTVQESSTTSEKEFVPAGFSSHKEWNIYCGVSSD